MILEVLNIYRTKVQGKSEKTKDKSEKVKVKKLARLRRCKKFVSF